MIALNKAGRTARYTEADAGTFCERVFDQRLRQLSAMRERNGMDEVGRMSAENFEFGLDDDVDGTYVLALYADDSDAASSSTMPMPTGNHVVVPTVNMNPRCTRTVTMREVERAYDAVLDRAVTGGVLRNACQLLDGINRGTIGTNEVGSLSAIDALCVECVVIAVVDVQGTTAEVWDNMVLLAAMSRKDVALRQQLELQQRMTRSQLRKYAELWDQVAADKKGRKDKGK